MKLQASIGLIVILIVAIVCAQSAVADVSSARALLEDHRYEDAVAAADAQLAQYPGDTIAVLVKSDAFSAMGEWDSAVEVLEDALKTDENNVDLLVALAIGYREKLMRSGMLSKMSNAKKSRKALEKAIEIDPNHLKARREMVMYLIHAPGMAGGDKERGEQIARETIAIDEAEGRFQMAAVYWKKDEVEAALTEFRLALELDPDNFEALSMVAGMLTENGDYATCQTLCGSYARAWPDRVEPRNAMGDCYGAQKMIDEAIGEYLAALEIDGWYGNARYKAARLYEKQKDTGQAAYHYRILLERNPGYIDAGRAKKQLRKIEKGR